MGTRSGGSGGLGGGRAAGVLSGGGGPPDDGREPTWYEKQKMIAGYQSLDEAREGGKKLFHSYDLNALQTVEAHKIIQGTLVHESRLNRIDLKSIKIRAETNPDYQASAITNFLTHGKQFTLTFNPNYFDSNARTGKAHLGSRNAKSPRAFTVSHEFGHIIQMQRTSFSTYAQLGNSPPIHPKAGFISSYARSNRLEEHAEAYATRRHAVGAGIARRISKEVLSKFPDERPKAPRNRRKKTGLD